MRKKIIGLVCTLTAAALMAVSFTGCKNIKVDGTKPAITVNGETLNMGTANLALRFQQAETYSMLIGYGFAQEGYVWSSQIAAGTTYGQYFKDQVETSLVDQLLLKQHAADYEVTLTEEDNAAISEAAQAFLDANPDSAGVLGCTKADVENLLTLYTYQHKMHDPVIADADTTVDEAEASTSKIIYARLPIAADSESGETEVTEERKQALKAECETVIEKFKLMENADAAMAREMAQAVDANFSVSEGTFSNHSTSLDAAVVEAAKALKDNEIASEVVETEAAYYVVWMVAVKDADSTASTTASIISEKQNTFYNELLTTWKDASDISYSNEWKKLTVSDTDIFALPTPEPEEPASGTSETSAVSETSETSAVSGTSETSAVSESSSGSAD